MYFEDGADERGCHTSNLIFLHYSESLYMPADVCLARLQKPETTSQNADVRLQYVWYKNLFMNVSNYGINPFNRELITSHIPSAVSHTLHVFFSSDYN